MERIKLLIDMPSTGAAGETIKVSPERAARWVGKRWAQRIEEAGPVEVAAPPESAPVSPASVKHKKRKLDL